MSHTLHRPALTAALGALALVATALTTTTGVAAAPGSTAADPSARAALPASIDYVALGDSYSAGPLIEPQRQDPAGCLRSSNNYPAYLAGELGVTTYRDVTCSGARVSDFFQRQMTIVPGPAPARQLAALSSKTDLVTVGIGGNDFGLFSDLIDTCEQVRSKNPKGSPCKRHFTNKHGVDTKSRDAVRIQKHVAHGLKAIHAAAPNAKVYVVGYPRLLPLRGTCAAVPFAKGDYTWGRHVEHLLNRSLERAATNHSSTYVDIYPASKGHDACGGDRAWINGSKIDYARAANFHPFKVGERGIAHAAYWRLTGKKAPNDTDAMPPPGSMIPNLPVAP